MYVIEWEASMLATLAASHWITAYEREYCSPRKRWRYETEMELDGVCYWLTCEVEMAECEHRAVSMICGVEPQYNDSPVRITGNMGEAIGDTLPVLSNFLAGYGVIYV